MLRRVFHYLYGFTPIVFESAFSLEESVQRLSAATRRSFFSSLTTQFAVGKVTAQHVSLRRVIPFVGNNMAPYFRGSFQQVGDKVQLAGSFSTHPLVKLLSFIWFGFGVLLTIFALTAIGSRQWWMPLIFVGILFIGMGLELFSKWMARGDIPWLSQLIEEALSE